MEIILIWDNGVTLSGGLWSGGYLQLDPRTVLKILDVAVSWAGHVPKAVKLEGP